MKLRITKPNEPVRVYPWDDSDVNSNNAKIEAYANQIKYGGYNDKGEVMQVDLVHDDEKTIIKTLLQHNDMKMISSANRVADFQKDKIAALEEEVANLRKLAEVNKTTAKTKATA